MSQLVVRVIGAKDLKAADVHLVSANSSDPFVEVRLKDESTFFRTKVIQKNLNPTWDEQFVLSVNSPHADILQIKVYDYDLASNNDLLGAYEIPVKTLLSNHNVNNWYNLWKDVNNQQPGKGSIHLALQFTPGPGVTAETPCPPKSTHIPGTPFASSEEAIAAVESISNLHPPSQEDPKTIPYRWPAVAKRWVAQKWGIELPKENPHLNRYPKPSAHPPQAADPIPAAWRAFANSFPAPGYVVFWNDASFNTDRSMYVLANNRTPYMFVYCATEQDVINTIAFARRKDVNLPISVKSQGHCFAGYSQINFGVVIDVSLMNSITPNFTNMTAVVGPGAQNHQISDALGDNYATTVGGCPQVGVGGYTLGGGFGLLSRSYGVMCDNVVSMRVVMPPLTVGGAPYTVTCDKNNYADLFYALRGAGLGSYGVVTQFTFNIYKVPNPMWTAQIEWPLTTPLLTAVLNWMASPSTPDGFAGDIVLYKDPSQGNQLVLFWFGIYNGNVVDGQNWYQKFVSAMPVKPLTQAYKAQSFRSFIGDDFSNPHNIFARNSFMTTTLPAAASDYLISMLNTTWGNGSATIEFCGGAINRNGGNAFNHRTCKYLLDYGGKWTQLQGKAPAMEWANRIRDALSPYLGYESYQNYPEDDLTTWYYKYYPSIYANLQAIKSKYDPLNVFYYEQSITPLSSGLNSTD